MYSILKPAIIFFGLFLFSLSANGQSVDTLPSRTGIEGHVYEEETGELMLFATVALYQDNVLLTGTDTDFDGYFILEKIEPGTYAVEVSFVGYKTERIENLIIEKDKILDLKIELEEGGICCPIYHPVHHPSLIEFDNTTSGQIIKTRKKRAY